MSAAVLTPAPTAIDSARNHHAGGQLLRVAQAYREALQSNPQSQAALLGLSLIARQSNQLQPALHMAQAALAAGSSNACAWANLGDILTALGQTTQAESLYRQALNLEPCLAAAHYGLGNTFALRDNFAEALPSFQSAAKLTPAIPEFHFAKAFAHSKLGEHQQAIADYRRTVTLRPGFAAAWLNLGVELIADGRPNLAHLCYREALTAPNIGTQISAHLNLGHLARSRRSFPEACKDYERALALSPTDHPRHAEVQVAFTYLHLEQNQFPEAWQSLRAAEAADSHPRNPEIPNVRGILLLAEDSVLPKMWVPQVSNLRPGSDVDKTEPLRQAIAAFEQAEAQGHKTAASNRGNALLRLGRCQEALAAQQAAVARDPNHPGVRYNLALTQLRLGDYTRGWPNYEIRWSFREVHPQPRRFPQPRWQGEPLPDRATLFIYAEQGLGDTLQFVRYLPLVAERIARNLGAPHLDSEMWDSRILLEVQPPLVRLLTSHFANSAVKVLAYRDPLPSFTHHCPLMSLPTVFQTTLETVPSQIPYLHVDPQLVQTRASEPTNLGALSLTPHLGQGWDQQHIPKIGISWAGNPSYRADRERSTCLATFLSLLEIPGIQWVSLQKNDSVRQITQLPPGITLYDGSSGDRDLADTAALIANLDLVLTTDTAVAHLAGALGKPLWLLLPWQSDWRWMQEIPTTPWYPSARLFRQSSPGNWPDLMQRVSRELHLALQARAFTPIQFAGRLPL